MFSPQLCNVIYERSPFKNNCIKKICHEPGPASSEGNCRLSKIACQSDPSPPSCVMSFMKDPPLKIIVLRKYVTSRGRLAQREIVFFLKFSSLPKGLNHAVHKKMSFQSNEINSHYRFDKAVKSRGGPATMVMQDTKIFRELSNFKIFYRI